MTNAAQTEPNRGARIRAWIAEQHAAGRTVYAATPLRVTKIAPKHADLIRVSGTHCEVRRGRSWDSINWCHLSAR